MYLFGDFCSGKIWGLSRNGSQWSTQLLADTPYAITTFGLGEDASVYVVDQSGGVYLVSDGDVVPENFQINAGLNDAWFDPDTDGQGFLITVFQESAVMFLAWFTYDVERPPEDVTAMLGEPVKTGGGTISVNGVVKFEREIIEPLLIDRACRFILSGVIEITRNDESMIIDFGDGECDNIAVVTKDGESEEIELISGRFRREFKRGDHNMNRKQGWW